MINQKPPINFNILIDKGLIFIIIEDINIRYVEIIKHAIPNIEMKTQSGKLFKNQHFLGLFPFQKQNLHQCGEL